MLKRVLAVLALSAPVSFAQTRDLPTAIAPVAYLKIPFGGAAGSGRAPSYGLQVNRLSFSADAGADLFGRGRPALVDLRFRGREWEALSFSGVNILESVIAYGADGAPKRERRVNWKLVIPAVVLGGWLAYEIAEDDDDVPSGSGNGPGN